MNARSMHGGPPAAGHPSSTPVLPPSAGRYTVFGQIGAGGMAIVQYAQFNAPGGFSRPVAIKRLHAHLASDPAFAASFLEEALLSARISHANVVATLDVLSQPQELAVVMEYIHGETLAGLFAAARARSRAVPHRIAVTLLVGVLHGLHAAHETLSEQGEPLGIVHRDVSPENILIGSDGVPRLLDFGIARARGRVRATPRGELKGKLGYMAPEQYQTEDIDRRVDVYGASVVLWEALAGRPLHWAENDALVVKSVMEGDVTAPSTLNADVPAALDALVLRGLARDREQRFGSARELALALEREIGLASQSQVSDWVEELAGSLLRERAAALQHMKRQAAANRAGAPEASTRRLPATLPATALTRSDAPASRRIVAASTSPVSASGKRPWLVALGLSVLVASGLALSVQPGVHMPAHALTPPRPPAPPAAVVPPAPPAVAPTSEPVATHTSTAEPSSVEPAPAPRRTERARAAGKVAVGRRESDCFPPYDIDAQGIRRWKRQCL